VNFTCFGDGILARKPDQDRFACTDGNIGEYPFSCIAHIVGKSIAKKRSRFAADIADLYPAFPFAKGIRCRVIIFHHIFINNEGSLCRFKNAVAVVFAFVISAGCCFFKIFIAAVFGSSPAHIRIKVGNICHFGICTARCGEIDRFTRRRKLICRAENAVCRCGVFRSRTIDEHTFACTDNFFGEPEFIGLFDIIRKTASL